MLGRRSDKRRLTSFVAAAYLAALATAALFHNHSHRPGSRADSPLHNAARSCSTKECPDHCDEHGQQHDRPSCPIDHDCEGNDCPICQYLVQKPMPLHEIELAASALPVADFVVAPELSPQLRFFTAFSSRGPPRLA